MQRVTELEKQEESVVNRLKAFDEAIKLTIRDSAHVLEEVGKNDPYDWSNHPFGDDPDFQEEFNEVVSNPGIADADDTFTPDTNRHVHANGISPTARGQPGAAAC